MHQSPPALTIGLDTLLSHGICQFLVFIPSRKTNAKGELNSGSFFVHEIEKSAFFHNLL
jgi:hypothetical protein